MTQVAPARLSEAVAEEIRVLLARRRMSASELARRVGWKQQYIARRMIGVQAFDLDDLERVAAALGVPVVDLLPRVTRDYRSPEPAPVGPTEPPVSVGPQWRPPGRADGRRPAGSPPPTRGRTRPTGRS